jgi:hypothetical protein
MTDGVLQPNQPAKFEARNLRPKFRRLKAGDIFLIECEVEEAVWNQLRTVPEDALLGVVLWHTDGDPEPSAKPEAVEPRPKAEKPAKEPAGPYGRYWNRMFANSFYNWPDLLEVLDCTANSDEVRKCLHVAFDARSLTNVGPRQWEEWIQAKGLPEGLITLSRNCEAQAASE